MTYYWPRTTDPYAPPSSVVTSAWPLWIVTTDTGWQRDTPRMRLRLRMCRRPAELEADPP